MPTGIEIAGIVLATIPLLISTAEHREVGLAPLDTLLFRKGQLEKLATVLAEEHISFRQCCEELLSIAEIENIADLLSEKAGRVELERLWADAGLRDTLQFEFGDDFEVIERGLKEIHRLISKLEKYLSIPLRCDT